MSKEKTNVEEFEFEPIKGYPMLNWKGKRPFRSTQYYPAQLKETYGKADDLGWMNKIFWGDNLQVMSHLLKEFRGRVDLIYIDPPFDSKATYSKKIKLKGVQVKNDQNSFEEKQYTDIWTNDEYLQFMYERLILCRELLSESGSIFLHCDWHKSHHLRCLMDEVFGGDNFINEITWCYSRPSVASQKTYTRVHDNIFWYAKRKGAHQFFADNVRIEYSESTKDRNKYAAGGSKYAGGTDERKVNSLGKIPEDYWYIPIPPGNANEIVGYPTQKPYQLIERIIKGSSKEGDLVFDCFFGSGTTFHVANSLGRKFVGGDINYGAISTTLKRLLKNSEELNVSVFNVNNYDVFRNPVEAKELLKDSLGITTIKNSIYDGELDGRMVKIMPINRIATRSDVNELINGIDYKVFKKRQDQKPNAPVEKITLICMGHEIDLKASLVLAVSQAGFKIDVEVIDILRDKSEIQFKRDSELKVSIKKNKLYIDKYYPMNLLQKLSLQKAKIENWKELTESIVIDWNYDGAVLSPSVVDIPDKNELVVGEYDVPKDSGTIRVKVTDLLSDSVEIEVNNG